MTWKESNLTLQLATEERAGFVQRYHAEQARAQQDASFAALAASKGVTP